MTTIPIDPRLRGAALTFLKRRAMVGVPADSRQMDEALKISAMLAFALELNLIDEAEAGAVMQIWARAAAQPVRVRIWRV